MHGIPRLEGTVHYYSSLHGLRQHAVADSSAMHERLPLIILFVRLSAEGLPFHRQAVLKATEMGGGGGEGGDACLPLHSHTTRIEGSGRTELASFSTGGFRSDHQKELC